MCAPSAVGLGSLCDRCWDPPVWNNKRRNVSSTLTPKNTNNCWGENQQRSNMIYFECGSVSLTTAAAALTLDVQEWIHLWVMSLHPHGFWLLYNTFTQCECQLFLPSGLLLSETVMKCFALVAAMASVLMWGIPHRAATTSVLFYFPLNTTCLLH